MLAHHTGTLDRSFWAGIRHHEHMGRRGRLPCSSGFRDVSAAVGLLLSQDSAADIAQRASLELEGAGRASWE